MPGGIGKLLRGFADVIPNPGVTRRILPRVYEGGVPRGPYPDMAPRGGRVTPVNLNADEMTEARRLRARQDHLAQQGAPLFPGEFDANQKRIQELAALRADKSRVPAMASMPQTKKAVWAMEPQDFSQPASSLAGVDKFILDGEHMGALPDNPTWGDVLKAIDDVMVDNGVEDHIYIEHISVDPKTGIAHVWTGS